MHKGIFLGLCTADIVYYLPHHPKNNEKIKAERQLAYAGGPAANAAVAFAALDNQALLITGLGSHPIAEIPRTDLTEYRVQLLDASDQPKRPPVLASVMVDLSTGERSVAYSNTDMRRLRGQIIQESLLEGADVVMLDGYYLPQALELAELALERRIPLVLDGGSWKKGLEQLLPLVDYFIGSDNFYPPQCADKSCIIDFLRNLGIGHIAITRDNQPLLVYCNGDTLEMPVPQVEAIDTLGAGDIFHGAFCHYILHHDFITSLSRATEIASMSCTSLGQRAWIEQERFI